MRKPLNHKRFFDLTIASVLLLLLSMPILVIGILVRIDGGKSIYKSSRVGFGGKIFEAYKFRSMIHKADSSLAGIIEQDSELAQEWSENFKIEQDPRVTRIGAVLRAMSIDELPQLLNVLKGDMSLVGPRPILVEEIDKYIESAESYNLYCRCQPGLTGLWQVKGRASTSYNTRVDLNNQYAKNWSLWLDLKILIQTPSVVFRRVGAW